jgi:hypothetical protein
MEHTKMPNKALDRMRGSAVSRSLQSNVMGALPLIGQLTSEVIRQQLF